MTLIDTGRWTTGYTEAGQGPPLILAHGLTLDRRMWAPQLSALSRQCRAVAYDLIGHGESSQPASYPPGDYAGQLLELMDALGLDRAHLCGLSMGAAVALRTALAAPERVSSLILANPYVFRMPFPPAACFLSSPHRAFRKLARSGDAAGARREWAALEMFEPARRHPAAGPALLAMVNDHRLGPWLDNARHEEPDDWTDMERIACPALVITSALDDPAFAQAARRAGAAIPGAQTVDLPGAGHLSSMEAPGLFSAAVAAFLAQLAP